MTHAELMIDEINEAASMASKWFQVKTRDNGDSFTCLKDGAPKFIKTMVHAAHETDMLPDDYIYTWVSEALDMFATENGNLDDLINEVEPDCYNWSLLTWVQSHGYRIARVDDILQDYTTLSDCLMSAQASEKREVYDSVMGSLIEFVELEAVA